MPAGERSEPSGPRLPFWVWAGIALLVLLSILTGLQTRQLQSELSALNNQLHDQRLRGLALDAERQHHERVLAILTSPATREFALRSSVTGPANAPKLHAFWNEQGGFLLLGQNVPAPGAGRVFQAWVILKGEKAVNCGTFRPDQEKRVSFLAAPQATFREASELWITAESERGSAQPTTHPLWKASLR